MNSGQAKTGSGSAPHAGRLVLFEYPAGPDAPSTPGWIGLDPGEIEEQNEAGPPHSHNAHEAGLRLEFEVRLAEETRKAFEAGRERGRQEGRQAEVEARAAAQVAEQQRRARQAAELLEGFRQERDRYLQTAEREVVELALAVAARILRREAQMDPLLLTGAVRVALGQIAGSTQVRLRVPGEELAMWTEAMALLPNLPIKPQVLVGEGMRLGDCSIETEMGSVDLGIRAQLSEIERGFFDRAGGKVKQAQPAEKPVADAEGTLADGAMVREQMR